MKFKQIVSSLIVLVALFALANVAHAQIVMPPVDNTDVTAQPASPASQVAPAAPAPKTTAPPTAPRTDQRPPAHDQVLPPVQPKTTKGLTSSNYFLIAGIVLMLLGAIGMIVYFLFFHRGNNKKDNEPEPERVPLIPARTELATLAIDRIEPNMAPVKSQVKIYGKGFTSDVLVSFLGSKLMTAPTVVKPDELTVTVPEDAVSGRVMVSTIQDSRMSISSFIVLPKDDKDDFSLDNLDGERTTPAPALAPSTSSPAHQPLPASQPSAAAPARQPIATPAPRHAPALAASNDELDVDAVLDGKRSGNTTPKKSAKTTGKSESKDKGKLKTAKAKVTKRVIKAGRRAAKVIIFAVLTFGGLANAASAQTGKVTKVSPDGFYQGLVNQAVTLTGTGLGDASAITFGNPAITATSVAASPTSLTAKVSVPVSTAVGRYTIKIVNKDGSVVDTASVVLYVFSRDSALVGGYVEGRMADQLDALRKELVGTMDKRLEGLKKTLTADTAKVRAEVKTRLNQQDARLSTFTEEVKARLAEIAAAKNELGSSISSLNARIGANETAAQTATAMANEAADDAELAMGLASETADKTVVTEASAIPFKRAKKETLSEGSRFVEAVKARLAEIAAAKK